MTFLSVSSAAGRPVRDSCVFITHDRRMSLSVPLSLGFLVPAVKADVGHLLEKKQQATLIVERADIADIIIIIF